MCIRDRLGIYHAKANRKNLFLMTSSFALSIILFLSFSVTVEFMQHTLTPVSYTHLTYPKPPDNQPLSIVNYDDDRRRPVADGRLMAWGELTYAKPLTEKQMEDYELKPAPGNPDRVRPSITARLKEGTRGQEPQKEPGQKRSHKNHEER